jgi:hypothetical protein
MSSTGMPVRPSSIGVGVTCVGAAVIVNVLMQLLSLTLSRAEPSSWLSLLLIVVLGAVLLQRVYAGYGLALVALGGLLAYALVIRVLDVVVTTPTLGASDISSVGMIVVWALTLLSFAQLLLLLVGAAALFSSRARAFVHAAEEARRARLNNVAEPAMVARVAVPLYLAAGAAVAIELVILLLAALPDERTSFTRWLGRSDFRDFVSWLLLLCQTPTLLVLVRRFRTGWLWARTTLTIGAAVIGLVDMLVVSDNSLPLGSQVAAVFAIALCAATIVVPYLTSVNEYFRAVRRGPADPAAPSAPPDPSGPFSPPEPS